MPGKPVIVDVVLVETVWTLSGHKYRLTGDELVAVLERLLSEPNMRFEDDQVVWRALQAYKSAASVAGAGSAKVAGFADALIVFKALLLIGVYVLYLTLGCLLAAIEMLPITLPFPFPVIIGLGYGPAWFGIAVVMLIEIGMLTPPDGQDGIDESRQAHRRPDVRHRVGRRDRCVQRMSGVGRGDRHRRQPPTRTVQWR